MSKKIAVVTGWAGFIGLTFTKKLIQEGWYVYGIDKFTYVANPIHFAEDLVSTGRFTWVKEDICSVKRLPECDVVFNLAAESDVDIGNLNAKQFIKSNIDGVRNLLEVINKNIVIRSDKPLFFQVSTDEVYGDTRFGSFNEKSMIKPSNPYSATKASADLLVQAWARTHGLEYIIARPSNNYGPFQYPEKLIPLTVKRLSRGKPVKLHNKGTPIRTWTHSEDTAEALITLYNKAERNSVYNISSMYELSNIEVVKKIINCYFLDRVDKSVPNYDEFLDLSFVREGQDVRYSISCNPLNSLGWEPKKVFDEEIVKLTKQFKERWIFQ